MNVRDLRFVDIDDGRRVARVVARRIDENGVLLLLRGFLGVVFEFKPEDAAANEQQCENVTQVRLIWFEDKGFEERDEEVVRRRSRAFFFGRADDSNLANLRL